MVTPCALQAADQREQLRRFLAGEIGGRLVEDQELGAAPRGARGRHQLLLADGERGEQRAGRQIEAEVVEQLLAPRAPSRGAAAGRSSTFSSPRKRLAATVRCGQSTTSWWTALMPRSIASCGRGERDRLAVPEDLAAAARMDAGQQLDQGRFAGAVFADDGVDFALLEGEVDGLQRMGGAEALVELAQLEDRASGAPDAPLPAEPTSAESRSARRVEAIDCIGRRLDRVRPTVSLDLRVEQLLRSRSEFMLALVIRLAPVSTLAVDLLALGGGERGLDAVIAHAVRVLHDEAGDACRRSRKLHQSCRRCRSRSA